MGWVLRRATLAVSFCFCATLLSSNDFKKQCAAAVAGRAAPVTNPQIKVMRAKAARVIYLNADLLKKDFPILKSKSDDEITAYVLQHYAYVTEYANDNIGIQHSGIDIDPTDVRYAEVPTTYGRAYVLKAADGSSIVDAKGTGVTYITKDRDTGRPVIKPHSVQFTRGAHHQHGLLSLKDALFEVRTATSLEAALNPQYRNDSSHYANQVYFLIDLNADVLHFDGQGNVHYREPAVIEGRQTNRRFYSYSAEEKIAGRNHFLFTNAHLFWRGLYHASLNRYNAEQMRYLDYGTFSAVPSLSYRITAMTYVPYGLSDFYGMFGEWSEGQARGSESPFVSRSWQVFLANLAVLMGMNERETVAFSEQHGDLGKEDLHQLLARINASRPATYRDDPSGKTFTQFDPIQLTEFSTDGGQHLQKKASSFALYRTLLLAAARQATASPEIYLGQLRACTSEPNESALFDLASALSKVEALIRRAGGRSATELTRLAGLVPNSAGATPLVRSEVLEELRHTQDRFRENRQLNFSADKAELVLNQHHALRASSSPFSGYLQSWINTGSVAGYLAKLSTWGWEKVLPVLTPSASAVFTPQFRELQQRTIGLIWRDTRAAGEQFGHSFIRVGNRIYDMEIAKIKADDFSRMMGNRFFYNFGMAGRSGTTPYHEVLFPISEAARDEMIRYFEARTEGRATVNGQITVPHFDVSGKGDQWGDGIVRENCGAFATSFNQERWLRDYPLLGQAVKDTGLFMRFDGATVALESLLANGTKPLAMVTWGASYTRERWERQHEAIAMTGRQISAEVFQRWPLRAEEPSFLMEAENIKRWALNESLAGYQATAFPSVSKNGELSGNAQRFNFIHLHPRAIGAFSREVAPSSVAFWWRWEPNGQYGHLWVSVGNELYDDQFGTFVRRPLQEFLEEKDREQFQFNGTPIFFVGMQVEMTSEEIGKLKNFFDARVAGKKSDGTPIPNPPYIWDQPFVKDAITAERCGMFSTSFANPAWQALFPELKLSEITERRGFRYLDGSLFIIHHLFHRVRAPKNLFVFGATQHVNEENIESWTLPTDSLPPDLKEPSRSAWTIGEKASF